MNEPETIFRGMGVWDGAKFTGPKDFVAIDRAEIVAVNAEIARLNAAVKRHKYANGHFAFSPSDQRLWEEFGLSAIIGPVESEREFDRLKAENAELWRQFAACDYCKWVEAENDRLDAQRQERRSGKPWACSCSKG